YISLLTCNHDTVRPRYSLTPDELKLFYGFLFTMPGVPFLYYGDEIGMRYLNLPTKEGGYFRTGSRSPMQWSEGKNLGFSEGDPQSLYLPVDSAEDAPTVSQQVNDPASLLSTVRDLLALRHKEEDLQADADFEAVSVLPGRPFIYRRGALLVAINPGSESLSCRADLSGRECIYAIGSAPVLSGDTLTLAPQSFCVLR
ncbi:MAG: DUF3459 domain-containing protein, partial [Clostridia bacterium]|nr:DUF3459 domain-containing protein [Clostridia bacterium]